MQKLHCGNKSAPKQSKLSRSSQQGCLFSVNIVHIILDDIYVVKVLDKAERRINWNFNDHLEVLNYGDDI